MKKYSRNLLGSLVLYTLHRFFVFITYLNDVDDGGETYFNHFKIKLNQNMVKL